MNKFIPDEIVEEIRVANNIVDVISDNVRLKKQGNNFSGLCPFHNEKTPSFIVSQDKQIFRCFGCGEGGNVFSFIMKRDNLNFPEAVRALAQRVNIVIPEDIDPKREAERKERESLFEINELVSNFYQYVLVNHDVAREARRYIESRGISSETIKRFQIGYAPPTWDSLLQFMKKKGYEASRLEQLGLVLGKTKGSSGFYDRFRNRIMFPIQNIKGRVIGFGGRVMDNSLPKYLNSPETVLFNKSHNLYGINKALDSIRRQDQVIIVEGYMDVITCHQAGINNVVASLGTAFTREQGKLLLRYTREIIMAYDADAAGVKATLKGWQLLDDLGCRVRVVRIPDGKDPDEFVKNHGPEQFIKLVAENSLSLCDYKTDRAMENFDIYTLEGKFKIASEVIPSIRNMANEIEKDEAIMKLGRRLHLSPDAIKAEVDKKAATPRNDWGKRDNTADFRDNNNVSAKLNSNSHSEMDARSKAERSLLTLMLEDRSLFLRVKEEIGVNFTVNQEYVNIISLLNKMVEEELDYKLAALFDRFEKESTKEVLSSLIISNFPAEHKDKLITDCLKTIKEDDLRKKREDLLRQMGEADKSRDHGLSQQLLLEYSKLI